MKSVIKAALFSTALAVAGMAGGGVALAQNPCPGCGSQIPIKDVDKILGEAGIAHGLLRSTAMQFGQVNNYEIDATGMMADLEAATIGAPVPVTKVVWNVHQQHWAQRLDFQGPNTPRTIRVVKGQRAWNEAWREEDSKRGRIQKITTTPADANAAAMRGALTWMMPHAFLTQVIFASGKKCLEPAVKACTTPFTVANEGGKTVLTVEINGTPFRGTLDANKRVDMIETTVKLPSGASRKLVGRYTEYRAGEKGVAGMKQLSAEGAGALDKFHNGVFWPEKIVLEVDGAKAWDLTVTGGWNNPYTIYPEPELLARGQ